MGDVVSLIEKAQANIDEEEARKAMERVAMVSGGEDYIDSVKLYHYGQQLEDPFVVNVASSLGLLDSNGGLARNDDGIYNLEKDQLEFLPSELAKAYVELKEYFDSNRAGFDSSDRDKGCLRCYFRAGKKRVRDQPRSLGQYRY